VNRFQRWYMKRIVKNEIKQGQRHFQRTKAMMEIIVDAWKEEFYEDNLPTTKAVLHECLESAINKNG